MIHHLSARLNVLGHRAFVFGETINVGNHTVTCRLNGTVALDHNPIGKVKEGPDVLAQKIASRL